MERIQLYSVSWTQPYVTWVPIDPVEVLLAEMQEAQLFPDAAAVLAEVMSK